jgi:hypothetical protein
MHDLRELRGREYVRIEYTRYMYCMSISGELIKYSIHLQERGGVGAHYRDVVKGGYQVPYFVNKSDSMFNQITISTHRADSLERQTVVFFSYSANR